MELPYSIVNAQNATNGTVTYIFDMAEKGSDSRLFKVEGGNAEELDITFPDYLIETNPSCSSKRTIRELAPSSLPRYLSPVAGDEALYLVGYTDKDKIAETWVLPYGSDTLQPYGKHLTALRPNSACAVFYDGKLYGIAADWGENESRGFRSTRVEGTEPPSAPEMPIPNPVPKTGDGANPALWIFLALAGLTGLAVSALSVKRKNS